MAVSGITTNYSGRTVDIYVSGRLNPLSPVTQPVRLSFGAPTNVCAGVQKLVQRFMIIFLTARGSQPDYPDFGSDFSLSFAVGRNIDPSTLGHRINFALVDTVSQIKEDQKTRTDMPSDERLRDARLVDLSVNGTSVSAKIQLVTDAGDAVQFLMPLPIT